jgi:two-component system response regulator NreC
LGLTDLLKSVRDVVVVGTAGSAAEADDLLLRARPDMVLLDLTLGGDDGMELARKWLQSRPELKVLVISMREASLFADRLLAIGVLGFVTKNCSREEFLDALHTTMRGDVYLSADQRARATPRQHAGEPANPDALLSEREIAVLRLMAAGHTASAIAAALGIAPKTVYSHRRNIGAKLGIDAGREMLRYAMQWFRPAA